MRDHPPTDRGTLSLRAVLPERGLDVAVDVPAGSTTAVIGRNGAGKTSLFEILIGALPAAAGSLRIGGTTVFD
ncbi:ATP-binding cassette domain-containing protein, partial [Mycobacterium tuberculosis]|nr:ATP-binding cassette domain-containing protein [Mycobacterium tuberculosis]